jgi:hypothetical protein
LPCLLKYIRAYQSQHRKLLRHMNERPNKSLQATATAPVSRTVRGVANCFLFPKTIPI